MNEESKWDHRISAGVKEGPSDCIRINEVAAALKKMKWHKAPGLSGLVVNDTSHMGYWKSVDIGFIVKEGCIPEDSKSSVVLTVYKGTDDTMECGSYRGIRLLEHAITVVERIFEHRIWQQIEIDNMQFGFMKGNGSTDIIFIVRQIQENFRVKRKKLCFSFVVLKRLLIGF